MINTTQPRRNRTAGRDLRRFQPAPHLSGLGRRVRLPGTLAAGAGRVPRARSGDQPKVPFIRGQGRLQRAGPAQPLQPGRDLAVIKIRVVAAVAADELEQPGVAAFPWVWLPAGRLAPQHRHHAVAQLARRDGKDIV